MENQQESAASPSVITYVVGAIIVLAVVGGAWYFRTMSATTSPNGNLPVSQNQEEVAQQLPPEPSPTPGPITGLACDLQYFNPKVGFPEYYLNAEGGDFATAKNVTCEFRALVNDVEVGRSSATSTLVPAPSRNGATFRCTTAAVALEPNIPTTMEVTLTDDLKQVSTCSGVFTYPSP